MRRLLYLILGSLLLLPLLGLLSLLYLQYQLQQAGISDIKLQGLQPGWQHLSIQQLRFSSTGPVQQVELQQLKLAWRWQGLAWPQWQTLEIAHLDVLLATHQTTPVPPQASSVNYPTQWTLPAWLPQQLALPQIQLSWPCYSGLCQLQANSKMQHTADESTRLQLVLQHQNVADPMTIDLQWYAESQKGRLEASIQLANVLALSLKQQFNQERHANTELALALSPLPDDLSALLVEWHWQPPAAWREQFTQPVQLFIHADWQLPATINPAAVQLNDLPSLTAAITLRAASPFITPWGWLAGETALSFELSKGQLTQWQANGELQLSHYIPESLAATFPVLPGPLQLSVQTAPAQNTQELPIQIHAHSSGALRLDMTATLLLAMQQEFKVQLQQAVLSLAMDQLPLADAMQLTQPQLLLALTGHWQADSWQISTPTDWQLTTRLTAEEIRSDLTLTGTATFSQQDDAPLQLQSDVRLALQQLQLPGLVPQDWRSEITLSGELNQLTISALSQNKDHLQLRLQGQWQEFSELELQWQLADIFLLAGNPIAAVWADWPALLSLQRGRLLASGTIHWQPASWQWLSQLELRELAGLYDRTLFSGLNSQLTLMLTPTQLKITIPDFRVEQLNHGLTLGPIKGHFTYQAPLTALLTGQLDILQLQSSFLLGTLRLQPQQLLLDASEQILRLELEQLDLSELLRQHPSTNVQAQGKLSGQIPLRWSAQQLSVLDGTLAAESPGGRLQYRYPATQSTSNPGLKLVFEALDDFHFSTLSSNLSYHEQGLLQLNIHLQGFNPAVQNGRAINLNINLEEDLPAMLASIQLASKLNDTITQRVQQYIQQRQAAKAAGEQP